MSLGLEFLRQVPLFRDLPEGELHLVAQLCVQRRYDKGQVIFTEEETGHSMYVVKEGRVKVSRWLPSGREVILAFHPAGDYFGEMALLDGKTLPATVTAMVSTSILAIGRQGFAELLRQPTFTRVLLETLVSRCRDAWHHISVLTNHHAEARVRSVLNGLCRDRGIPTPAGIRIEVPLTHREIAAMSGISRETVTRTIRSLVETKLILVEGRTLVIPDPDALLDTELFE